MSDTANKFVKRLAKALHKPFVHAKLRQSRLEKRERAQFQHGDVEGEMADAWSDRHGFV